MIIKKLVVGSMLSMLMASGMASADWGDVYYCQMTNLNRISIEGKQTNYKLEKFQFKLDHTKNAMVFGSKGYFTDTVVELVKKSSVPSGELWYAKGKFSIFAFEKGNFLNTSVIAPEGITSLLAKCDKF